jgi:uncharacterized LabA/DUF88 family protein
MKDHLVNQNSLTSLADDISSRSERKRISILQHKRSAMKTGIYVDAVNIMMNGGWGMRYDVLKQVACRNDAFLVRANAYVVRDREKEREDVEWRQRHERYFNRLRSFGFKLIEKAVMSYYDEAGHLMNRKANADLELAIDALVQSDNLDRILLVTGDGDFTRLVTALQNRGCRVEVLAFKNISNRLRQEADIFINGYLIPNLLPIGDKPDPGYAEIGSRVRGIVGNWSNERGFGVVYYLSSIILDLTDITTWESALLHKNSFKGNSNVDTDKMLDRIVEFSLRKSRGGKISAAEASILEDN